MTDRLYEIVDSLKAVEDALIESGGEASPELEAALAAADMAFEAKIESCAMMVRNFAAQGDAAREEEKRLAARKTARWKAAERLKDYMLEQMQRLDRRKVEGTLFTVRVQKNGRPSIRWTDPDLPPPLGFQRQIPARVELDADLALAEWRATGQLPEGFTVDVGFSLRIA
jgi:hypothetical protein